MNTKSDNPNEATNVTRISDSFEPSQRYLKAIFDASSDMILTLGEHQQILDANQTTLIELQRSKEELFYLSLDDIVEQLPRTLGPIAHDEWQAIRKDGSDFYVDIRFSNLPADIFIHGQKATSIATLRDITERKQYEVKLHRLAHYDPVTGLINRTLIEDRARHAIVRAKRYKTAMAFIYLDLDRFKGINDTLGHHVGDKLLRAASSRMQSALRDNDTLGRLGGDEFLILAEDINDSNDAEKIAKKLLRTIDQPFGIDTHRISISTSIGISIFPDHGEDIASLISHADKAMYDAKALGRNRYKRFIEHYSEEIKP